MDTDVKFDCQFIVNLFDNYTFILEIVCNTYVVKMWLS